MKDGKVRGLGEYCRFISDPGSYERFDASRVGLWRVLEVEGLNLSEQGTLPSPLEGRGDLIFARAPIGTHENIRFSGYEPILCTSDPDGTPLGTVKFRRKA
jgi:hypothetical protein